MLKLSREFDGNGPCPCTAESQSVAISSRYSEMIYKDPVVGRKTQGNAILACSKKVKIVFKRMNHSCFKPNRPHPHDTVAKV